jgi:hypothetical protein
MFDVKVANENAKCKEVRRVKGDGGTGCREQAIKYRPVDENFFPSPAALLVRLTV